MATDWYPSEEGAIFEDAAFILPCYPDAAITEMSSVKPGTSAAGRVSVAASTAMGDGIGVALRAATDTAVPERIPVLFYGGIKTTRSNGSTNITSGNFVMNSITTTVTDVGTMAIASLDGFGGASHILGMALQTTTADSDEILVLVGKGV